MIEENLIIRNNNDQNENISENELKKIKDLNKYLSFSIKAAIIILVCRVTFFLIFPLFIGYVIQLIWCVKTLTLNNEFLKNDALLWGLMALLLIPVISIFIMRSKTKKYLAKLNKKI